MRLIDNWRRELKRLWTVRVVVFWSAIGGLIAIWPAFAESMPLWLFGVFAVVMSVSFGVARFLKQPGAKQ